MIKTLCVDTCGFKIDRIRLSSSNAHKKFSLGTWCPYQNKKKGKIGKKKKEEEKKLGTYAVIFNI